MIFKAGYFWWCVAPLLKVEALVSIVLYSHYFMQEIKLSQNLDPEFTTILSYPEKKGKITGNMIISWENLWFPVDFPLSQSIEYVVAGSRLTMNITSPYFLGRRLY